MSTANINIRVDSELKKEAESLFADLGLNMTTAVTMFLRSAIDHDGIPFEITRKKPNKKTVATIQSADRGEDIYGPFETMEDFWEALNA